MSETALVAEDRGDNAWRRFWNRGGWWKAVLVAAVYLAIYQGLGWLIQTIFAGVIDTGDVFGSPLTVFFALALPILLMALLTLVFVRSLGWQGEIFGRQPVRGRWWMWIAVALILVPTVIRLFAVQWSAYSATVVLSTLFFGLCVGLAEELLTRGVAVNLLRRAGYTERVVFVLSSLLFGLLHSVNILSGQSAATVLVTVVYTFGFGAMMYLSMIATGRIVWAILLHAATDPVTFLAAGGIDAHGSTQGDVGLLAIGSIFNYVYILAALIAIFFVKGKVYTDRSPRKKHTPTPDSDPTVQA
ncbi:CPBP family intramembrane glutamic endopeptidase [Herbiconiux sp. 11R-BC]|uniref:CPBP family intramembrane glutamic endopeptidase n=1 Tax=Herbiconiux sp. 11R-BC TaxID=3111637 RepID=UPI003BFCC0B3